MRYILFIIILLWAFIPQANAQNINAQDINAHCAALDNPKTYKDNESYRYLIVGGEKKDWVFRSRKDLKQDFALTPETVEKFLRFNQILKSKGKTLHIVMPPTRGIAHAEKVPRNSKFIQNFDSLKANNSFQKSLDALRVAGISIADFSATPKDVLGKFYYQRDHHWTSIGAKYSAAQIAALLKEFQSDLPPQKFITETTTEKVKIKGSFEQFIEKTCGFDIPDQTVQAVKTFGEGDLFGESSNAAIALIGTSNTTEPAPSHANFAGYLREFVQSDVENLSIQGAGILTPMAAYLASERYTDGEHKHIIWELASHYDFNGKEFAPIFRQIIPAAAGMCADKAIHTEKYEIKSEKIVLLDQKLSSDNHYIAFKFDAPTKKDFAVSMKFDDGKSERFRFKREGRYPHDGIYFLDLNEYGDRKITALSLLLNKNTKAKNLDFEICAYPTL